MVRYSNELESTEKDLDRRRAGERTKEEREESYSSRERLSEIMFVDERF
jgi:hypothetical protein